MEDLVIATTEHQTVLGVALEVVLAAEIARLVSSAFLPCDVVTMLPTSHPPKLCIRREVRAHTLLLTPK